jgi:hypothetical protein
MSVTKLSLQWMLRSLIRSSTGIAYVKITSLIVSNIISAYLLMSLGTDTMIAFRH